MSLHRKNIIAETVSASLLAECVIYDPETGGFVWRERPAEHFPEGRPTPERRAAMWNGKYAGKPAFTSACPRGYLRGAVRGMNVYAHRAAFACVHGRWPAGEIDHINRDKSDNRIENLREVSHRENRLNTESCDLAAAARAEAEAVRQQRKRRYAVAGLRRQPAGTWAVRIRRSGVERSLGTFPCFGSAVKARINAERGVK